MLSVTSLFHHSVIAFSNVVTELVPAKLNVLFSASYFPLPVKVNGVSSASIKPSPSESRHPIACNEVGDEV